MGPGQVMCVVPYEGQNYLISYVSSDFSYFFRVKEFWRGSQLQSPTFVWLMNEL
jgi:hypothetical protein